MSYCRSCTLKHISHALEMSLSLKAAQIETREMSGSVSADSSARQWSHNNIRIVHIRSFINFLCSFYFSNPWYNTVCFRISLSFNALILLPTISPLEIYSFLFFHEAQKSFHFFCFSSLLFMSLCLHHFAIKLIDLICLYPRFIMGLTHFFTGWST